MSTEETLRKAKAALLERGWYQGDWCDGEKRCVCAMGAINVALDRDPRDSVTDGAFSDPLYHLERAISDLYADELEFAHVPDWNDAKERTFPEVLTAFDRAIALAEAGT